MKIKVIIDCLKRQPDGLANVSVEVPALNIRRQIDISFEPLYQRWGIPKLITLDFLLIASVCYVIDKTMPRKNTFDKWTREFEVEIPVSAPDLWQGVAPDLKTALGFLSGDIWQFSFCQLDANFFQQPKKKRQRQICVSRPGEITSICLFSGGLDSLLGAIELLTKNDEQRVILIGHSDTPGPAKEQKDLFAVLQNSYPQRAELLQIRVKHKPLSAGELTLRSRSLLFMALGIYAAQASGFNVPLYAPENGLIAINIPLTPSRAGTCSTRTMHPFFLDKLIIVLEKVGIKNPIINPFRLKTKGECAVECLNQDLLSSLVNISVSCSHPNRRRYWVRRDTKNCGYCVPCIIRRAALHKVGLDDGQKYGIDICDREVSVESQLDSADDLRAILDFLRRQRTVANLTQDILRVAPVDRVTDYAKMLDRSFNEIRSLIRDKGNQSICQAASITHL